MNIHIRYDPIIGMITCPFLPQDLIEYIQDFGVFTLQHARNISVDAETYWLLADKLDLGGSWETIWNNYTSRLEHGGIILKAATDKLQWTYNRKDGKVTAALVYDLMVKSLIVPFRDKFAVLLWHVWNCERKFTSTVF